MDHLLSMEKDVIRKIDNSTINNLVILFGVIDVVKYLSSFERIVFSYKLFFEN